MIIFYFESLYLESQLQMNEIYILIFSTLITFFNPRKLIQFSIFSIFKKMGSQHSQAEMPLGIRINVLDSSFIKQKNQKIRAKMDSLHINYQVYVSISCFIQSLSKVYTNEIITTEQLFKPLKIQLERCNFYPNVYVLASKRTGNTKPDDRYSSGGQILKLYKNYQDIINQLSQKTLKRRRSTINSNPTKINDKMAVKIFRNIKNQSSQVIIFQETLKAKNISYESYRSFSDLQASLQAKLSDFVVTDYVYHRQVLNLMQKSSTKVICFCDFIRGQSYDSRVFFTTNNFLEIVQEIALQKQLSHLNSVKCSKVFIYSSKKNYIVQYAKIIQAFDFQVKISSDLTKIINQSKHYFAITILISGEQKKQVQAILQRYDYTFKTKLVQIKQGAEKSVLGLRKIIKQLKKGYKAQKSITRSIDIIDKHFDKVKLQSITKQLQKCEIKCYGYNNINSYLQTKRFMSPFIICSYQQRSLIQRYIKQVQSKSKLIIFCNKNNISQELKQNKHYEFVSSHFGKIINYIKKNKVYNPCIIDQHELRIRQKKERIKREHERVSALKWSGENAGGIKGQQNIQELEQAFQFLNVNTETPQTQVLPIQRQCASLFKLDYSPLQTQQTFRQDLARSLRKLKTLQKVSYPAGEFQRLLGSLQSLPTCSLILKIRQFFSSHNQMGHKINKSLIDLQGLTRQYIHSLREYLFIVNMNYLTVYTPMLVGNIRLCHFLHDGIIQNCLEGSWIFNRNYSVFYQAGDNMENKLTSCVLELQMDSFSMGGFFHFNNKFIFCPFSQFRIKKVKKTSSSTIITVEYKKNVQFLKMYFQENFGMQNTSIVSVYNRELQKSKQKENRSFLFDSSNKEEFKNNFLRTKAIICFQNGQLQQAIQLQKQLITEQKALKCPNSCTIQLLTYQLACFYSKSNQDTQCRQLLAQLWPSQPQPMLKQKIKSLTDYCHARQSKQIQGISDDWEQQVFGRIHIQPPFEYYYSDRQEEIGGFEEDWGRVETGEGQGQFRCLDVGEGQEFKENIY